MSLSQAAIDDLARKGAERGVDLRAGLGLVEQRLRDTATGDPPFMDPPACHLIDAGGKRFRPMLVLLAGLLGGAEPTDAGLVDAGVVVELVHLSTLYHDDVIDGATLRRGAPAAQVKWSNTVAILTGDFLLARASELSAALGVAVTKVMAATLADLCAGQILEVKGSPAARAHGLAPVGAGREHYLAVIAGKTASLIASSCRLGGLLSGQPGGDVDRLAGYGWHLGMSFQLADDILDIASEETESGKQAGTDLREGVRTLPVLYALEAEGPRSELARVLAWPDGDGWTGDGAALDDDRVAAALAILRRHPAIERARGDARAEAARAKHALDAFRAGGHPAAVLEGLDWLADYAADRAG